MSPEDFAKLMANEIGTRITEPQSIEGDDIVVGGNGPTDLRVRRTRALDDPRARDH